MMDILPASFYLVPVHQMIKMEIFYHRFAIVPDLVRHLVQVHGIKRIKGVL